MIFYSICALGILIFPRRILWVMAVWIVIALAVWIAGLLHRSYLPYDWTAIIVLEFGFGVIVALLAERKFTEYAVSSVAIGTAWMLLGAVYFRFSGGWTLPTIWRVTLFGLPSAFIVYGFVALEVRQMWTFSKSLDRLWGRILFIVSMASASVRRHGSNLCTLRHHGWQGAWRSLVALAAFLCGCCRHRWSPELSLHREADQQKPMGEEAAGGCGTKRAACRAALRYGPESGLVWSQQKPARYAYSAPCADWRRLGCDRPRRGDANLEVSVAGWLTPSSQTAVWGSTLSFW